MLATLGEFGFGLLIGGGLAVGGVIILAIFALAGWMNSGSH